ncbi:hypothetical protein [Micromonospora carbonacea]|uniref:hypothetical protein n=1 Tax=Micromonospora carbonacea TaxID=47853 RepID=UPI003D726B55
MLRPAGPPRFAGLYEGRLGAQFCLDKETAATFALAWGAGDHLRTWHREFRDHLRWDVAADTLVRTGSREAFELQADKVRALAEECPAHRAHAPETHCCAEISMGRIRRRHPDHRRPYAELHAEYTR